MTRLGIGLSLTVLLAAVPSSACAQRPGSARQEALDAVVARGIKAMADGQGEQARAAWSFVLAFEPGHPGAKKQLESLSGGGFSINADEQTFVNEMIGKSNMEDWCGFPPPTPEMDLINLRMLADSQLLPNLRATDFRFRIAGCDVQGVFIFLGQSRRSMEEVRQTYGRPQSEKKATDGSDIVTYGRLRLTGSKDGSVIAVVFPPFQK